jgi:hypothetical protein
MFKPLTRPAKTPVSSNGGFAETMFLHSSEDEDYSGFAPTQMACREREAPARPQPASLASSVDGAPHMARSWATARWAAKQEAAAHMAAEKAHAAIAAQRRADEPSRESDQVPPRTALGRLLAAVDHLLPLFIGVSVTMALIAALLPLFDRP